jgi:DNA-binding transcriptional regulator YiaG
MLRNPSAFSSHLALGPGFMRPPLGRPFTVQNVVHLFDLQDAMSVACASLAVGRRIHELRRKVGLTQEELAVSLRVGWRYVSRAERGEENLTLETLARVANALGVRVKSLLNEPRTLEIKAGRPKLKRR